MIGRPCRRQDQVDSSDSSGAGGLQRLCSGIRLYIILVGSSIRARMEYRTDFVVTTVIQAISGLYEYLMVAAILWRFSSIAGWNMYEVGILFSISGLGYGLYRVFCSELERFENYIITGQFDALLVRPWPSLFILFTRGIDLSRIGWFVEGAGIACICVPKLIRDGGLVWADIWYLSLSVVWEFLLFAAVGLATASAAFWIVRIEELQVFTQHAPKNAMEYPLDIYPKWLRLMLTWVIPLAVGNYVPVVYLLGKGGSTLNLVMPAIVCPVALYLAWRLWCLGERRYHSTGS